MPPAWRIRSVTAWIVVPAVPDLVDDEDALAAQQRIGRELEERGTRPGWPSSS